MSNFPITTEWHAMREMALRLATRGYSAEEIRRNMRDWVDDAAKYVEGIQSPQRGAGGE